jgi:hypothetical protein
VSGTTKRNHVWRGWLDGCVGQVKAGLGSGERGRMEVQVLTNFVHCNKHVHLYLAVCLPHIPPHLPGGTWARSASRSRTAPTSPATTHGACWTTLRWAVRFLSGGLRVLRLSMLQY